MAVAWELTAAIEGICETLETGRYSEGHDALPVNKSPCTVWTVASSKISNYQYFPVFTVNDSLSKTYLPAAIGGYLAGFSSLMQEGSVSTVSS